MLGENIWGNSVGLISGTMLLSDILALYLVHLQKPFIFFNWPLLELVLFWWIMSLDLFFDFAIMFVVFLIWQGQEELISVWWWTAFLFITTTTFLADIEQATLMFFVYDQGELDDDQEQKFKKMEGNDINVQPYFYDSIAIDPPEPLS